MNSEEKLKRLEKIKASTERVNPFGLETGDLEFLITELEKAHRDLLDADEIITDFRGPSSSHHPMSESGWSTPNKTKELKGEITKLKEELEKTWKGYGIKHQNILSLEEEVMKLRAALEKIVSMDNSRNNEHWIAKKALEDK